MERLKKWLIGSVSLYISLGIFDVLFRGCSLIKMARLTGIGVAVMFGMDILGIISVILNRNLLKSKPSTAVEKGDRLGEMLKSKEWALTAITATLMEELLFRGPLYIMVFLRFPWLILILATIVDGVLFGYTHFRETLSLRDFCFKLGVGVFLSWLVIESGSLIPSISCHLFPNLIWMTLFRWADKNSS